MTAQPAESSRPGASGSRAPHAPASVEVVAVLDALRAGDVDAAIAAGLMELAPAALTAADDAGRAMVLETRQRLLTAWAARERFRARQARLTRREAERRSRRAAFAPPSAADAPAARPPLPAAAAAALARARARALPGAV